MKFDYLIIAATEVSKVGSASTKFNRIRACECDCLEITNFFWSVSCPRLLSQQSEAKKMRYIRISDIMRLIIAKTTAFCILFIKKLTTKRLCIAGM